MDKKFVFDTSNTSIFTGTHVVTKVRKHIGNNTCYNSGMPGVVKEVNSKGMFIVEFADNGRAKYAKDELIIRRRIIAEDLKREIYRDYSMDNIKDDIVYECIVGSKAYGLSHEGSDTDIRGIYIAHPEAVWSFTGFKDEIHGDDGDVVIYEIEKFMKMMMANNPSVIDIAYNPNPYLVKYPIGELIENRDRFLCKHVFNSYGGYTKSQYALLKKDIEEKNDYRGKHAGHCLRILLGGITLLKTGKPMIDVGEYRDVLLGIIKKEITFDEASGWKDKLVDEFNDAFEATNLPDKPDYEWANKYLISVRKWKAKKMFEEDTNNG